MSGVAPGWYDDGNGHQRWWDGQKWTEYKPVPAPYVAPQPQVIHVARRPSNGLGVAGFVLSLVACLCLLLLPVSGTFAVLGLIFSILGMQDAKKTGAGNALAAWGSVLSGLVLLFVAWVAITSIVTN